MSDHKLTVDGTCTCGFASHKVRSVRIHITKANQSHGGTCDDSLCDWCGCCMHTGSTVVANCRAENELPSGVHCPNLDCGCGGRF